LQRLCGLPWAKYSQPADVERSAKESAARPFVPFKNLNRRLASVHFANHPELNVSAQFLTTEGIRLAIKGNAEQPQDMMSLVTAPVPYLPAMLTMGIVRTVPLVYLYRRQLETSARLGNATVYAETDVLAPIALYNVTLQSVRELAPDAGFIVSCRGYCTVNDTDFGSTPFVTE
jgi:hypothetical protein